MHSPTELRPLGLRTSMAWCENGSAGKSIEGNISAGKHFLVFQRESLESLEKYLGSPGETEQCACFWRGHWNVTWWLVRWKTQGITWVTFWECFGIHDAVALNLNLGLHRQSLDPVWQKSPDLPSPQSCKVLAWTPVRCSLWWFLIEVPPGQFREN